MATDILGFLWNTAGDNTFSISDPLVGNLELDTVDQILHEWNREVTRNPVENGSPVGDHIIKLPKTVTITGMVSNAPVTGIVTQATNALENGFSGDDRVSAVFKLLEQLYESNELVTIYTKYHIYENMLITSIPIPESPENGEAVVFSIEATQIRIVETATTNTPPGVGLKSNGKSNSKDKATANRATPAKDLGKNPNTPVKKETISVLEGMRRNW